jgi:hypothetical protein
VWLRQRSPQQPLSHISRLSLMNADEALRLTGQREIYIANSRGLSGRATKEQYNVWLQLPRLTLCQRQNALYLNASEPKSNGNTDNLTWTLECREDSPTPQPATLTLLMVCPTKSNSDADDTLITTRLEFFEKYVMVYLQAQEEACQIKATARIPSTLYSTRVQLANLKRVGLHVTAVIEREYLNGQQWHIVKLFGERDAAQSGSLRSFWHALKAGNCGSASAND